MLWKFLMLPIAISTAITSCLSFFPTAETAQDYPICYMVTSLGERINLDKLCQNKAQIQTHQKARACQGPFDNDGFPVALSNQWEQLKAVATKEIKREDKDYSSYALEFQFATMDILKQVGFSENSQKLIQEHQLLLKQLQTTVKHEDVLNLEKRLAIHHDELTNELEQYPCYDQLMQSLQEKLDKL